MNQDYSGIPHFLRGDSGFSDVLNCEKLEFDGVSYAVLLKEITVNKLVIILALIFCDEKRFNIVKELEIIKLCFSFVDKLKDYDGNSLSEDNFVQCYVFYITIVLLQRYVIHIIKDNI